MEIFLLQLSVILLAIYTSNLLSKKLPKILFGLHSKNTKGNFERREFCLTFPFWVKVISFIPFFLISILIVDDMALSESNKGIPFFIISLPLIFIGIFIIMFAFRTKVNVSERGIMKTSWYSSKSVIGWSHISHVSVNDNSIKLWNIKGAGDIRVSLLYRDYYSFYEKLKKNVSTEKWSVEAKELMSLKKQ